MSSPETTNLKITLPGGAIRECAPHTPIREILAENLEADSGLPWLGALVNHDVCALSYPLTMNCELLPVSFRDRHGSRIYRRTLAFLLAKAVRTAFPEAHFAVEHSLGSGYYCSFQINGNPGIRAHELGKIEATLNALVKADLPILRRQISY
ncbi:MAG: nucleoside kinase, partial [Verrucomicrobia bacterium]|nr:nucleoside kinase [Verrucomicrobiota bacterium]